MAELKRNDKGVITHVLGFTRNSINYYLTLVDYDLLLNYNFSEEMILKYFPTPQSLALNMELLINQNDLMKPIFIRYDMLKYFAVFNNSAILEKN